MCGPIVRLGDASKPIKQVFKGHNWEHNCQTCIDQNIKPSPLLAGSVPDLQFDLLSIDLDSLDHKVDAYGRSLPRREHALKVTFIFFSGGVSNKTNRNMKKQRGKELTRVKNINNKQQQTKEEFKKYEKDISQQQ